MGGQSVFHVSAPFRRRLRGRLDQRLRQGLIDEVRDLLRAGLSKARMNQLGLEYREVTAYLTGTKTEQQMIDDLRHGIRQFAKRQRTWFRGLGSRGIDVTWVGPDDHNVLLKHEF